jgi:phosphoribosylamine--glycine ligase
VFVTNTIAEARAAIDSVFRLTGAGDAAPELLIEEFMLGEELSVFAVTDGENAHILVPSQDHKRLLEGDSGPNTGGMGAYAPVSLATPELIAQVEQEIIAPTLAALNDDGSPFRGLLYAGLMISEGGNPMVVEFNCRFGDPETQVVLPLLRSPLLELLVGATRAAGLSQVAAPRFYPQSAATTILAAPGYPDRPVTGGKITLPPDFPANTYLFHAGTRSDESGSLVTAGGRVFAVTGVADTLDAALQLSQSAAGTISFEGMRWRRDIGWRELRRLGGGH